VAIATGLRRASGTRDVALTFGARFALLTGAFATSIVTARSLGPTGRGQYFLVATFAATVVQLCNLGLHSSNTYFSARDRRLFPALVTNSLWVSAVVGGVVGAASVAVGEVVGLFPMIPGSVLWFAAALVPPSLFFLLGANLLVGVNRIGMFNAIEIASRVVVLGLLLAAGLLALGVTGFLALTLVGWIVVAVALAIVLVKGGDVGVRFRMDVFRLGFRYALKTYLVALLGFLVLRSSIFMLERLQGSSDVGYFSIAAQVADVVAILPMSVALVLFPRLVRDAEARWDVTRRNAVVVGVALTAVAIVLGVAARPLIELAFGTAFAPSANVLRGLLPGIVAIGVTTILSQHLAAVGLPRMLIVIWLAGLGMMLGLGRWLIPTHAGVGAAVALSATYCFVLVAIALLAYRHRHDHRHAYPVGELDLVPAE
jgi:O-antigen/teichoic acid export membrane protein